MAGYGVRNDYTDASTRAGELAPAVNALSNATTDLDLRVTSTTSVANEAHSWAETANNRNDSQDSALDAIRNRLDNVEEASAVPGPMGQTGPPGQDGIDGSDGQDGVVSSIVDANDVDQTSPTLKFTGAEVTSNGIVTTVAIDGGGHIIVDENGNDVPQQPRLGFSGNAAPDVLNVGDTTFLVFTAEEGGGVTASGVSPVRHPIGGWRSPDTAWGAVPSAGGSISPTFVLASPLMVSEETTFDALMTDVKTASSGGRQARLGIYATDPSTGHPTTLLGFTTVDTDTTGIKSGTLAAPITVQPGLYALAVCSTNVGSGGGTAYYTGAGSLSVRRLAASPSLTDLFGLIAWSGSFSTNPGNLPATFPVATVQTANGTSPAIAIRRSA